MANVKKYGQIPQDMTFADFKNLCREGLHGVFLFYGPEDYLKSHAIRLARKSAGTDGDESGLSHVVFSGLGKTPSEIGAEMEEFFSSPSFMTGMKTAELHNAPLIAPKKAEKKSDEENGGSESASGDPVPEREDGAPGEEERQSGEMAAFCDCLKRIGRIPDGVLLIVTHETEYAARVDGKKYEYTPLHRMLSGVCRPVEFKAEDEKKLAVWMQKHFASNGVKADPAVCGSIMKRCGHGMATLSSEIDKVSWLVLSEGRDTASDSDVERVCSENIETQAFELVNAVSSGNTARALIVLDEMKRKSKGGDREAPKFFGQIAKNFSLVYGVKAMAEEGVGKEKIASSLGVTGGHCEVLLGMGRSRPLSFFSRVLSLCRETDIRIKTTSVDPFLLLELLIVRIRL